MKPSGLENRKRFYKEATVSQGEGSGFQVLLDGREIKTPARNVLRLPSRALAAAIAAEWNAQGSEIVPASMPLSRLANTAIDGVVKRKAEVAADILSFAAADATCYRAAHPAALAALQAKLWDPVLEWVRARYGAEFHAVAGIRHEPQPPVSLEAIREAISGLDASKLTALHVMTALSGSALIALACCNGFLDVDQAWAASQADEDWQASKWGEDHEAAERRASRFEEFRDAARFFHLS